MKAADFLRSHADERLSGCILAATETAKANRQRTQLSHLLAEFLRDDQVTLRLPEAAISAASARLSDRIRQLPVATERAGEIAFGIQAVFEPSIEMTRALGGDRVTPLGFLATCLVGEALSDPESIQALEILRSSGVSAEQLGARTASARRPMRDFVYKSLGFGLDLTAMARAGWWEESPVVGMEKELERLTMLVSSRRDSVVLVGEPGVGKSALVEGLAFHLARGTRPLIPPHVANWSIVMISPTDLRADTGVQGALESRLKSMLEFFQANKNVIPFFDELHTLLNTEDPSTQVLSTALKPAMARGAFRCIGATTSREYARFITSDEAMKRRFSQLLIPEPTEAQTLTILQGLLPSLITGEPRELGISLPSDTLAQCVALTTRYQRTEYQPAKSINLLSQVITERVYRLQTNRETRRDIAPRDIAAWFSDRTGIPVGALDERQDGFFEHLRSALRAEVFGQDDAIESVVSWLELQARGWLSPQRPRGRFLFFGPSGVGKTELAVQLADQLIRDRSAVIVRNMANFGDQAAKAAWQGAPPGYVGFGTVSTVYSEVMVRPYSVVILDAFESMHESLIDVVRDMLDGSGQDAQGRRVDFSQCIFVLSSNDIPLQLDGGDEMARQMLLQLGGAWRPEMLDRIDRVVGFKRMTEDGLRSVLRRTLARRKAVAARPLPPELDEDNVQAELVSASTGPEGPSARMLERVLAQWFIAHSSTREAMLHSR